MEIRRATAADIEGIDKLLYQVNMVHHNGRPDLFKAGGRKYTDEQLLALLADDTRPVFAAVDEAGHVLGYAFCILQQHPDDNILTDIKTLYIDDLCVRREYPRQSSAASAALRVRQTVRQRDRLLQPDPERLGLQRERQKVL